MGSLVTSDPDFIPAVSERENEQRSTERVSRAVLQRSGGLPKKNLEDWMTGGETRRSQPSRSTVQLASGSHRATPPSPSIQPCPHKNALPLKNVVNAEPNSPLQRCLQIQRRGHIIKTCHKLLGDLRKKETARAVHNSSRESCSHARLAPPQRRAGLHDLRQTHH